MSSSASSKLLFLKNSKSPQKLPHYTLWNPLLVCVESTFLLFFIQTCVMFLPLASCKEKTGYWFLLRMSRFADGPAFCEVADAQYWEEPTLVTILKTLISFLVTSCHQGFQNLWCCYMIMWLVPSSPTQAPTPEDKEMAPCSRGIFCGCLRC